MKRYTSIHAGGMEEWPEGGWVKHADHEAAVRDAVAKRDDEWATAIAKYAAYSQCKAIADDMSARKST